MMRVRHRLLLACIAAAGTAVVCMRLGSESPNHADETGRIDSLDFPLRSEALSNPRPVEATGMSAARADAEADPDRTAAEPSQPSAADEERLLDLLDAARREADPARRHERLVGVCLRWAGFDPPAAIALAIDLRLDALEGALLPNLAQQWAARDLPAARAWASNLPPGELRDEVYSRIVYEQARRDPAAAAALLAGMRSDGAARGEAALTVLHFWAEHDPAAARVWAAALPTGKTRESAKRELAAASNSVD